MSKTDKEPKKTVENLEETIKGMVRACIHEEIGTILNMIDTKEKVMFSTINTIQNAVNLLEKTFSYKLGAIQAVQTKNKAKGMDFDNPEEALAFAEFLKSRQIRDIEEPHPLNDK